jgi:hypothetical protein
MIANTIFLEELILEQFVIFVYIVCVITFLINLEIACAQIWSHW